MSIMLNIAESSSRFTSKDRRHFLIISRGSAFECAAILELINDQNELKDEEYQGMYDRLEEISKMLFSLINKLKPVS